ncbi:unnamed protein product [Strongylus vulgaris]|uniref:Uncharacterized protein n=1 Tax=Strongylus vulgaris TaxID=40348 RepID=A0A3P7J899_STRVU|nr:unnamed protein product [Strongylus vulgaris]
MILVEAVTPTKRSLVVRHRGYVEQTDIAVIVHLGHMRSVKLSYARTSAEICKRRCGRGSINPLQSDSIVQPPQHSYRDYVFDDEAMLATHSYPLIVPFHVPYHVLLIAHFAHSLPTHAALPSKNIIEVWDYDFEGSITLLE